MEEEGEAAERLLIVRVKICWWFDFRSSTDAHYVSAYGIFS